MALFDGNNIKLDVLKKWAYNYRWAEVPEGTIPLTAADPDYPVAPEIRKALRDYVDNGYFSYTPKMGYPEFMEAASRALWERKHEKISQDCILPIDSAARGMYIIAETYLKPGDEMIVFDPVDYLFKESCLAAGGVPVLFPAKLKDGYIDLSELERYITPKTKMIGLCNPHNPYGVLYRPEDLEHIMSLCEKYDLYIMNDEIWSDIVYPEQEFLSILSLGEERTGRVMSVFGFSKSFGIAGLRAGMIYCTDKAVFERLVEKSAVMTTAGGIASVSQIAGITCLKECYYWVDEFISHLVKNRDYAVERINSMPVISCHKPQATYLLYVDISGLGVPSAQFTDYLIEHAGLALVPGGETFFGPGSEGAMRICFATSREILEEGLNRLETGLKMFLEEKNKKNGEFMMHENLQVIQTMLRSIHQMLGDRYEVILHDLSHVESSIVGIEGCITHRKIGGPATNYLIQLLREYGDEAKDSINYKNVMPDGRVLRSSTIFIRDNDGKIIGSLCINQDLTDFMVANRLLERLVEFKSEQHEVPKEMFAQDISEVMEAMVGSELALMNKPVAYMQKEDKLALVDDLERKGVFDVKGSVEYVAECLGVTNFTVYNYLKEIRTKHK